MQKSVHISLRYTSSEPENKHPQLQSFRGDMFRLLNTASCLSICLQRGQLRPNQAPVHGGTPFLRTPGPPSLPPSGDYHVARHPRQKPGSPLRQLNRLSPSGQQVSKQFIPPTTLLSSPHLPPLCPSLTNPGTSLSLSCPHCRDLLLRGLVSSSIPLTPFSPSLQFALYLACKMTLVGI